MIRMLFLVVSILGGAQVTVPVGPAPAERCAFEKPHAQRESNQARLSRATALLAAAQTEQTRAQADLARVRVMAEEGGVARQDLAAARLALDSAETGVTRARAQVAAAELAAIGGNCKLPRR
jgi:multidrug resistance efflux pump